MVTPQYLGFVGRWIFRIWALSKSQKSKVKSQKLFSLISLIPNPLSPVPNPLPRQQNCAVVINQCGSATIGDRAVFLNVVADFMGKLGKV